MNILLIVVFCAGYAAIAFENILRINKTAIALLTGVLCWAVLMFTNMQQTNLISEQLITHLGEIAGILFFLLAAMTVVELIDAHDGFEIIKSIIQTRKKV